MTIWGARVAPEFVVASVKRSLTPGIAAIRQRQRDQTHSACEAALRGVVPDTDLTIDWPAPQRVPPLLRAVQHRRFLYRSAQRYGDDPAQLLDVWRRGDLPIQPAPVLIFVPGGAWVHGRRALQGYALLSHLADLGWLCLSIDYRVAPRHRWPQHIIDVKTAIAWARNHVSSFGGDPGFIALAGGSAGGHLSALAGLTGNQSDWQAELPAGSNTAVDAVVAIYGRYDWEDRSTLERRRFVDFLEKIVVRRSFAAHRDIFHRSSPVARIHAGAPPFMVIHGTADTVIPVAQARSFVAELRSISVAPLSYLELPGAGHGFDMTDGARTASVATAVGLFLNQIHRERTQRAIDVV